MKDPVQLELSGTKIVLRLGKSEYDPYAAGLAGKVKNDTLGVYEYSMSIQNLTKIFKVFDGVALPKPVVTKGQDWLEKMRHKYVKHRQRKDAVQDIIKMDRYPVEPNGKFVPYAHQTKIVGSVLVDPYTPVFADCGTGKTGSVGRAVELVLASKEVTRGKVLISAPLSILATSWADDLQKFTNLKFKTLWTPMANKTKRLGDKLVITHGLDRKPEGTITVKSRKAMRWVKGSEMKKDLNVFDEAEGGWVKMEVSWKEAISPEGIAETVGPIYGQTTEKEKTRENFIRETLREDVDVFIINHDGVRIYEDILKEHEFEWVIVDESTKIKSVLSKVCQAHVDISWSAKRRTIMSGTPNPNGFLDMWSQFYFLDRGLTLSTSLKDFRHDYFTPVKLGHFGGKDAIKWELRDEGLKKDLIERIKHASIFLKQRDCLDLPPRTDMVREVFMTPEQTRVYLKMEKELVAELLDHKTGNNVVAEATNTLSKLMKLRQITSGYLGHAEGIAAIETLENNPKYDELDSFIEELQVQDKKLVIACQFKEEINALLNRYQNLGAAAIYGDWSVERRNQAIRDFQTTNNIKVMILQPQAAAHGITLTEAHYFVFVSLDYNFEFYYQTGKRIERLGQKNPMFVYHLLAKTDSGRQTIDHDLMEVLKDKAADRDALFDNSRDIVDIADTLRNRLIERVQAS